MRHQQGGVDGRASRGGDGRAQQEEAKGAHEEVKIGGIKAPINEIDAIVINVSEAHIATKKEENQTNGVNKAPIDKIDVIKNDANEAHNARRKYKNQTYENQIYQNQDHDHEDTTGQGGRAGPERQEGASGQCEKGPRVP